MQTNNNSQLKLNYTLSLFHKNNYVSKLIVITLVVEISIPIRFHQHDG